MSLSLLSLPVDIPWKRLATSTDMYSADANAALPYKWRSSLTVYRYDPAPDPDQPPSDESTTFLKIVATITGYQPDGHELDADALSGTYHDSVVSNFEELTGRYYAAYAALLQVAVYPEGGTWALDEYPYLADFEPKKRELIELVSDTGESVTQSASGINVRKGTTSIDSTEDINIDKGGSFGMNVSTPYGGGGFSESHQQEVGTKSTVGTEAVNLVTTDASREKRESYSHTTNLSQLYQLLDSYHGGTNRVIFFVNARPHLKDSPYTFVNGPRYLEGIQEFFLVVRRPAAMEDFCVKAVLETAHLRETDTQVTTGQTRYDQQQLDQTFTLHADGGSFSADDSPGQWTMNIPGGYHLDRSRGDGPYHVSWGNGHTDDGSKPEGVDWSFGGNTAEGHESEAIPAITTYDDHVDVRAHVYGVQNVFSPDDANMTYNVTVFTESIDPVETPQTHTEHHVDLFLTAREVTSCPDVVIFSDYVSFEQDVAATLAETLLASKQNGPEGMIAANAVGRAVREQVLISVGSQRRYLPGRVGFFASETAMRVLKPDLGTVHRDILDRPLSSVVGPELRKKLGKADKLSVGDALRASPGQFAQAVGLSHDEAGQVLLAAIGLAKPGSAGQRPPEGKSSVVRRAGAERPSAGRTSAS
jgi:hypothetical protein